MNRNESPIPVYQPGSGGILLQPVLPPTVKQKPGINLLVKVKTIRVFSYLSICLGIASIGIQIAALVIYTETMDYDYAVFGADVVGHGIWAGAFYVVAGSLGAAATSKRTRGLLIGTIVMSAIATASSIVATVLSGIAAGSGVYYYCYYSYGPYDACESWNALEWTLMAISIASFFTLVPLLVFACVGLCSKSKKNAETQQPYFLAGNGQPIYFQQVQPITTQPLGVFSHGVVQQPQQQFVTQPNLVVQPAQVPVHSPTIEQQ